MSAAIDRELQMVKDHAGAPRPAQLGCTSVSHDRLGFCSACEPSRRLGDLPLEVLGWRLLAMKDAAEVVHQCPPQGSGVTPCCDRVVLELPRTDRLAVDPVLVTCRA